MSSRPLYSTSMDDDAVDGDEISDDDPIGDQQEETTKNQHIRDNFKVDNERGDTIKSLFLIHVYIGDFAILFHI